MKAALLLVTAVAMFGMNQVRPWVPLRLRTRLSIYWYKTAHPCLVGANLLGVGILPAQVACSEVIVRQTARRVHDKHAGTASEVLVDLGDGAESQAALVHVACSGVTYIPYG